MDRVAHLWRHADAWKFSLLLVIGITLVMWLFPPNPTMMSAPKKTGAVQTAPVSAPGPVQPVVQQAGQQWQRVDNSSTKEREGQAQPETNAQRMQRMLREMDTLKPKEKTN